MRLVQRVAEEVDVKAEPTRGDAGQSAASLHTKPLAVPLSARETEILHLIAVGKTNREIASELMVSLSSIKTYLKRLMDKLEVSDRTQAAVRAIDLGLLSRQGKG